MPVLVGRAVLDFRPGYLACTLAVWAIVAGATAGELSAANPTLSLSQDTTRLTQPLDAERCVDYAEVLRERYSRGVTPENNVCTLLWEAIGTAHTLVGATDDHFAALGIRRPPDDGPYFVPFDADLESLRLDEDEYEGVHALRYTLARRPWTAAEFPQIARWLAQNERPLAVATEAVMRPRFFSPLAKGNDGPYFLVPEVSGCRDVAHALALRAMLSTGEGHYESAWNDLQTCFRLARHLSGTPSETAYTTALKIESYATRSMAALAAEVVTSEKHLRAMLSTLDGLGPLVSIDRLYDETVRYGYLELIQHMAAGDADYLARRNVGLLHKGAVPESRLAEYRRMDFGPALREGNRRCDEIVAAWRLPDRSARNAELDRILADIEARSPRAYPESEYFEFPYLPDGLRSGRDVGSRVLKLYLGTGLRRQADFADGVRRDFDLAKAVLMLNLYRTIHGSYPETLDDVATQLVGRVPDDFCSGRPLRYRKTEAGYQLYSVGLNGLDDGGRMRQEWIGVGKLGVPQYVWDDIRMTMPLEPEPY
jgi:hypothetical protein